MPPSMDEVFQGERGMAEFPAEHADMFGRFDADFARPARRLNHSDFDVGSDLNHFRPFAVEDQHDWSPV
jgi:hypothetical protein